MRLRVLLLQARTSDDPMAAHEHACFADTIGLAAEDVIPHDLEQGPPGTGALGTHDAVMVGGSGDYSVSKGNLPHFQRYLDFLLELVAREHPAFLSCFGFQSLVRALGGTVVEEPGRREVGTYDISLSAAGRDDPLFGQLPETFAAQLGHQERATEMPPSLLNLAASERCPYQALRVLDAPVWGTQFHPELDHETNFQRLEAYSESYRVLSDDGVERPLEDYFRPSPEASSLLRRFVDLVFV